MDIITQLNIATSGELLLMGVLCYVLVKAIKQTTLDNKWLPWISMTIGICIGLIVNAYFHDSLFAGGITGFLVGAATCGLFDGFSGILNTRKDDK